MHLFVDISSHGFGHLAIAAPVLNRLAERLPGLKLTIRCALPPALLASRLRLPFRLIPAASDFGFVMRDALHVDLAASADAYRAAHRDWAARIAAEAALLSGLAPDLVLADVSYLPLAGAAAAGIPAMAICSLNWADLFAHFFTGADWAAPIHAQMLAAYRSARAFLRITPGMPMPALDNIVEIGAIAAVGERRQLAPTNVRHVLIAMGGIGHRLPIENWPRIPGLRWLVPSVWRCRHPDATDTESSGLSFTDLLASVDAVVTKPGYGTFTEAVRNGTPVLYQRRADWPEQDCLIDWLESHARCGEISPEALAGGQVNEALTALWAQPPRPRPPFAGTDQAADLIAAAIRNA